LHAVAVFPGSRKVDLVDVPEPEISSDDQVKVRMLEVGICGTDREISRFEYGTPPADSDFLVMGHEGLGEVAEVGPAVADLKPGDLVVPLVRYPCPHERCHPCRVNRQDFCVTGDFRERGIKELHGFMCSFITEQEQYLVKLPSELRDVGVLTEPLTIAEKAFAEVSQIYERLPWMPEKGRDDPIKKKMGELNAVVVGAGPMGLLGAMRLRLAGYSTFLYSLEPDESVNARIAREVECHYVSAKAAEFPDLTRIVGHIDLVYEASGSSAVSFGLLKYLGKNGIFILTGVPPLKKPIPIDADRIMRNMVLDNQLAFGTVNAGRADHEKAIRSLGRLMERWPEATRSIVTKRHPLEATCDLLVKRPPGIKQVVKVG